MAARDRVTVTAKRQITLPAEICRDLGIDKGDLLEVERTGHEIHLRPVPRFPPLTKKSSLFRTLGSGKSSGGPGARNHDRVLADEAARPR